MIHIEPASDLRYRDALASVEHALKRLRRCTDEEKRLLCADLAQLRDMADKLAGGRVEIVVFGEISTGKSALINALLGRAVAAVDVRGGWTREVWRTTWDGCGYRVPGLDNSEVVLVDTPGLNEVGGQQRGQMAREAAQRADLILFVTDSDLNDTEYAALCDIAALDKPVIVVFNKADLYTREQRERLLSVLRNERLAGLIPPEGVVLASADPREVEYVIEAADRTSRSQWRKPEPDVTELKARVLELLARDGLGLLALNAAMYAADKSDRIAALRVSIRSQRAAQVIWSFALLKSAAVAINGVPVYDVLGGGAVDAAMVVTLAQIYGLKMTWASAHHLVTSIAKAAGWMTATELATHALCWTFKAATLGWGVLLTAVPQGAAAGYGSHIVGQAASYYFQHGASWGGEAPKTVVARILKATDKQSVIEELKTRIRGKLLRNRYSRGDQ